MTLRFKITKEECELWEKYRYLYILNKKFFYEALEWYPNDTELQLKYFEKYILSYYVINNFFVLLKEKYFLPNNICIHKYIGDLIENELVCEVKIDA